jgi:hypothetical protein
VKGHRGADHGILQGDILRFFVDEFQFVGAFENDLDDLIGDLFIQPFVSEGLAGTFLSVFLMRKPGAFLKL